MTNSGSGALSEGAGAGPSSSRRAAYSWVKLFSSRFLSVMVTGTVRPTCSTCNIADCAGREAGACRWAMGQQHAFQGGACQTQKR